MHAAAQWLNRIPASVRRAASAAFPRQSIPWRLLRAPRDPLVRNDFWLDHAHRGPESLTGGARLMSADEAVRAVLAEDIRTWLVEDVLAKVDRMSMAVSLEARCPFLDGDVADFVTALPAWRRMSWRNGKTILRDAMRSLLPGGPAVAGRRKQAFLLPVDDWLGSEWRPIVQDVLLDPRTLDRGWFDPREVRRLAQEQFSGAARHGRRLYQLLTLELWARHILDAGEAEPAPVHVDDCCRDLPADRPIRKVAVLAPAGLGDTLRLTPALAKLGKDDPAVSVTLYVDAQRGCDEMMTGIPPVDRQGGARRAS
jgi:hypothetical protein